ncbi:sigma-70 family RNA polymerase sigma factor [Paraflavitalea sp. CAU 1676]|uniref:RNA polymerase sigma factor n=1 Tax=Paraflavitalea sp. CAU 1676 TaxID=3032598 RepID=UPI0023DBF785|nr:sigma-70 family RNA polymerase sigma factor [Paraflavitalea sp. CAU 1676]MDF2187126.1 sigma-70 family RNA polymerase sigma factor [Paraflavitalea sp. CAU 1676]
MSAIPTYSEQELVSLLKNRDNKAFGYLYDHYSGALYSIILAILNDTELANDVLQDVFVNIWKKIESYDPAKGRLFTWMLNIARNASIDTLRSKTYQNDRKNQSMDYQGNGTQVSLVTQVNVDNIGFKKVLNQLKEEQRALIDLAYFKGYTHEEIAEMENIPLGTVKTRIRSALIQLRGFLK